MNTKIIKFDLNKYKLYEKIKAKQRDTKSRFLLFQLLDGSIPFSLQNRTVRAYMIKPDGKEVFNDLIVNNYKLGYCTLELTNQVLAVQGAVKIELMVTQEDKKLTSSVFELEVIKSINSEKSIVSTNEFTALLNGLASLSEYDNYKNEIKYSRGNFNYLPDRLDKIDSDMDTIEKEKATKQEVDVERKRIDNFTSLSEGSTTGDAELIDARIGADGVTYSNIGNAIRTQNKTLNEKLINNVNIQDIYRKINYSHNLFPDMYFETELNNFSYHNWNWFWKFEKDNRFFKKLKVYNNFNNAMNGLLKTNYVASDVDKTVHWGCYIYVVSCTDDTQIGLQLNRNTVDSVKLNTLEKNKWIRIDRSKTLAKNINNVEMQLSDEKHVDITEFYIAEPFLVYDENYIGFNSFVELFKNFKTQINNGFNLNIRKKEIVMTNKLVTMQGIETPIHFDNILKNTTLSAINSFHLSDISKFNLCKKYAYYKPTNASSDTVLKAIANIYDIQDTWYDKGAYDIEKEFTLKTISKDVGVSTTKKVMFIGDSIVGYGLFEDELVNLFQNDVMNIELIGTLNTPKNNKHEGRGGWSAKYYTTYPEKSGVTNAFWNPTTNKFDFSYYMQQNSFTGVDYVYFGSGINDLNLWYDYMIEAYKEIITSIKAYNSNVKILLGLPIMPCEYEHGNVKTNNQSEKNRRLDACKKIISEFDNRESEGIFVVPTHIVLDTENDFRFIEKPISSRNPDVTAKFCTDFTHPATCGFNKIADMLYVYIKYISTLS